MAPTHSTPSVLRLDDAVGDAGYAAAVVAIGEVQAAGQCELHAPSLSKAR